MGILLPPSTTRRVPSLLRLLPALALSALASCGATSPGPPPNDGKLGVLFIGNSLTYTNDLPAMVKTLADAAGEVEFHYQTVAFGNYALQDHWDRGDALTAIQQGGWDFVVMQQGPSSLPESRVNLIQYTRMFAEPIRDAGARPALYMVWPTADRVAFRDDVTISYTEVADAVDGMLFPAGEAFREAMRHNPHLTLFSPDGFHPSSAGTYLAALVIYAQLTHRSAVGLTLLVPNPPVSAPEATVLEAAADAANGDYGRP